MSDSQADTTEQNAADAAEQIEEQQRQKYQEHHGMTPEEANEVAERDMNPGVNDGHGLEVANPDDFFIKRSGDDAQDIEPVLQKIPGRPQAMKVRPFTSGMHQKYLDPVDYDDDEKLAEMFNLAFPDLSFEVTEEDVAEGMLAYGPQTMVDMIERAAGKDMQDAIENRNLKILNQIDPGKMSQMLEGMNSDALKGLQSSG